MFLAVIFKAGLHILDFFVNYWLVGLRNSKFITFSDRHTSRSKLRSTLSFHRIFSYFVNCLFFQLAIRCWRWCFCKCILFDSRLAIALSSPKLVLHESRSVSAFCNISRPDIFFILRILNQHNSFQFQTWNVRLLHWQSQFTYWEAACKLVFAHTWKTEQLVFGKLSSSS